ncbi:signal peptide peptidase SppA [bacterium]|nr:signal peptide peptidase SppA [bacterium]
MSSRKDVLLAVIVLGAIFAFVLIFSLLVGKGTSTSGDSAFGGNRVGVIDVIGPIYDSREWVKQIDDFRSNSSIAAMVIRIDSPGGGVAASQELFYAIRRARDAKPVIISMGGVAASGGYYAALGGDFVFANPGTTTGSIGVILQLLQYYELMEKIGIDSDVIKTGKFKDTGSPFRDIDRQERQYLEGYAEDAYEQFVEDVAENREMDPSDVRTLADGRIFTGRQALESGLVDSLGDQWAAIQYAGELGGIQGEPRTIKPPKKQKLIDLLMEEVSTSIGNQIDGRPLFQYRWEPGGTP